MGVWEHIDEFAGYSVRDFDPALPLEDPANTAYRLLVVPEQPPSQVGILGCLGALAGIGLGIVIWAVTGKWGRAVAIGFVSMIALGALPGLIWSFFQKMRPPRCPRCKARLQHSADSYCDECTTRMPYEEERIATDKHLQAVLDQAGRLGTLLGQLISKKDSDLIPGLILGDASFEHDEPDAILEPLVAARNHFPHLKALFLSELTVEECEISWIDHGDVLPLMEAYPNLERFQIRGCGDLSFDKLDHANLQYLIIESGGLAGEVIQEIAAGRLPELRHLELWIGSPLYGADVTEDDMEALLTSDAFPRLEYLGLRNYELVDDILPILIKSPILRRLRVLDLSLGCLSDVGAEHLLKCPAIKQLKKLDIHYHFVSDLVMERLQGLGIEIDASEPQDPDGIELDSEERYCSVGE